MKRLDYLRGLSSEHHQALRLCRDVLRGLNSGAKGSELVRLVKGVYRQELLPHFCFEEVVLCPEMERLGERMLADQMKEEHVALRSMLEELERPGMLREFAELLKSHVNFEERVVFQRCQATFDDLAVLNLNRWAQDKNCASQHAKCLERLA